MLAYHVAVVRSGQPAAIPLGGINVEMINTSFLSLDTKLSFYNALIRNRRLVLKTTLNSSFRTGDSFMFYQAAHLGGKSGLRGYRAQRFSGSKAIVSNLDFRYSFNTNEKC